MQVEGYAYFVRNPRRIDDLLVPHPKEEEQPFAVAAGVALSPIDYDNFIHDMTVDRPVLEEYSWLYFPDLVRICILVHQKGCEDGILVIPKDKCRIGWAAYFCS